MKLWAMPFRATQDRWVMVESSDKTWSTGERNGKPLQYSCLENPMNTMKRQKDRTLKDEFPRSVGAQYATGDQWRNNSRKNEGMEPNQNHHPVVDVTDDGSNVWYCKKQYYIVKNLSYSILLTEKLHFVRFREKSLWKSPDLTPPPTSQSDPRPESPDLTFRNLWST